MGLQCLGEGAGSQDQGVVEKATEDVLYWFLVLVNIHKLSNEYQLEVAFTAASL